VVYVEQGEVRSNNEKEVKENVSERTRTRQVKLVALLSRDGRSLLVFAMVRGVTERESLHLLPTRNINRPRLIPKQNKMYVA
jgi:hypothetical protein